MKMSAVSTCTRFWRAGIEPAISDPVSGTDERFSPLKPTPELLRVSERISRDCSSLEWIGKESNLTTWNNGSLYIHKLCPLCASYPFEYYPPFGSINRLTQTQEPFVPRKHVTSDNMFFRCFSACTSTAHFLSARAVQGWSI